MIELTAGFRMEFNERKWVLSVREEHGEERDQETDFLASIDLSPSVSLTGRYTLV